MVFTRTIIGFIASVILHWQYVSTEAGGGFIDLTFAFNNETVLFPGRKNTFNVELEGLTPGGFWIASKGFCISEHTGTHIDAPYHFQQNGKTLDQIPLEDLIDVPGVMIDMYDKVHKFANGKLNVIENYALTREDIVEWEKVNGAIPPRALVLLRSGWGSRWPNGDLYKGTPTTEAPPAAKITKAPPAGKNAPPTLSPPPTASAASGLDFTAKLNFPGFDASAAQYLTTERQIVGVGIDTLSIDVGSSKTYPAHVIFAARGAYMLENVANLHLLPPRGFQLWAVPFKVDRGTGAPTRVLARIDKNSV